MGKIKVVVFYGPSAGGKSTAQKALKEIYKPVTTATTRPPREGEVDGVHYHFKTLERFKQGLENDEFLEHVEYVGNFYGTPMESVREAIHGDSIRTLVLDVQGMMRVKKYFRDETLAIWVGADVASLERRFIERGSSAEEVANRIKLAVTEELTEEYIGLGDLAVWNNDGTPFEDTLKKILDYIEEVGEA